eukprot:SAG31_NODE_2660_length_5284_cov_14.800000_4_plen_75_part_00
MLFAPVTKIFWEKKFLMKSKVPVMNERMVLIVLIVTMLSPPLLVVAVVSARLEKTRNKELFATQLDSESMQVSS